MNERRELTHQIGEGREVPTSAGLVLWGGTPERIYLCGRYGRHDWTRTSDLYRVNFEVTPLKPFSSLAFPLFEATEMPLKQPSFGDELVTSFSSFEIPNVRRSLPTSRLVGPDLARFPEARFWTASRLFPLATTRKRCSTTH